MTTPPASRNTSRLYILYKQINTLARLSFINNHVLVCFGKPLSLKLTQEYETAAIVLSTCPISDTHGNVNALFSL